MKKSIIVLFIASLLNMGHALANNVLTVSDVNVPQGGQTTIEVGCEFDKEYTAFELQMSLPEGLSLLSDEDGKPIIVRAFDGSHVMSGNLLPSNGNYKFTCYSTDENDLSMPTSGILFRVTIMADANLSVGADLTASITACEFTRTSDSNGENLDDVDFNVHITEFRTILDESSTTAPVASNGAVDVRVKRTITAGNWSTICLPFAMTEAQVKAAFGNDVELADFTGYETTENGDDIESITVNFDDVTAIEVNHPYIIKVSSAVTEFTADGVTIAPEDNPCVEYDNGLTGKKRKVLGTFTGTYVADFDFYNEAENYPLFISQNKFYYATENTNHMKAFRAYFDFVDNLPEAEEAESRIFMRIGDKATGIRSIRQTSDGSYYDLQGRRVVKPGKGLYVKDGRKVVVK